MTRAWVPLITRREQVRAALAAGPLNQAELAATLGINRPAVSKIMRTLVDDGDVQFVPSVRGCGCGPWPTRYALDGKANRSESGAT